MEQASTALGTMEQDEFWHAAEWAVERVYSEFADHLAELSVMYALLALPPDGGIEAATVLSTERSTVTLLRDLRGRVWLTWSGPGAFAGNALQVDATYSPERLTELCLGVLAGDSPAFPDTTKELS